MTLRLLGNSKWRSKCYIILEQRRLISDPGATATDEEDGTITAKLLMQALSNPNVKQKGTYTITYTASDEAGNVCISSSYSSSKNDAEDFAGYI
ncbi:MAG: DUF5011 domain-containing protein [Bacteroidetes bacterium]|nr:DUF5011 domain-containing protein [Bacteroidota bacterium]